MGGGKGEVAGRGGGGGWRRLGRSDQSEWKRFHVPVTCRCVSGTDLLEKLYVLTY